LSNQTEEKALIEKYKEAMYSKDYELALEIINKLLSNHPKDENYLNEKGIILTNLGKHKEAIEHFENSFEENSKNTSMWNNKGLAHCNLRQFDEAINCFKKSYSKKDNENTNVLNNEGLAYYYKGKNEKNRALKEENFKKAIIRFDKVIEQNPENSDAFNNKGNTLFELGWHEESARYIYKSLELNPENANALNNRGRILAISENYTEAVEYYNKALKIDKRHTKAWNNKGIAMANLAKLTDEQKYFSEAEKCYDEANRIDRGKFVDAINNKAMLYVSRHNFVKADELVDASLKINESNQETMDKKGIVLLHLQKYDEALSWFKKATENNPENKVSRYHMGNVYMQLKKYDEAIECFDESLKDNLDFAEAHNAKASALFNKGNQKEATKEVKRAIEIKPSLAVANENIAKITSSDSPHFQNFWDFWKSSIYKKIVGITLFALLLGTTISITFHIISNILISNNTNTPTSTNNTSIPANNTSTPTNTTEETQLMDISEGYLVTLGIILFILLIPEIKKAKMGPMEFELEEQHVHPTKDSPSLSETHNHTL
jgi:tetratricopeptide (TPR) repeat protein